MNKSSSLSPSLLLCLFFMEELTVRSWVLIHGTEWHGRVELKSRRKPLLYSLSEAGCHNIHIVKQEVGSKQLFHFGSCHSLRPLRRMMALGIPTTIIVFTPDIHRDLMQSHVIRFECSS